MADENMEFNSMKVASVTTENSRRFLWLRFCLFISMAWTAAFGGLVVINGQSDLRHHIKNAFAPSKEELLAEWTNAKIELMKEEFGHTQETLSDFRLRMYGDSTNDQIVDPTNYSIPWPSTNLQNVLPLVLTAEKTDENLPVSGLDALLTREDFSAEPPQKKLGLYERLGAEPPQPKDLYERFGAQPSPSLPDQTISESNAFDLSTAVPIDENATLQAKNSRQSLISDQKLEGRWLDLARQDEAIDNEYRVKLNWSTYEYSRTRSIHMLQEIIAVWLVPICSIFALGAIFNLPWFSNTNKTIRVRRRLALSSSILWVVLMVPISIFWELGNEIPPASLAAAFLCPLGLIWLCYVLWSWTLRE